MMSFIYWILNEQSRNYHIVQSIYVKKIVDLPLIATEFIPSPVVSENVLEYHTKSHLESEVWKSLKSGYKRCIIGILVSTPRFSCTRNRINTSPSVSDYCYTPQIEKSSTAVKKKVMTSYNLIFKLLDYKCDVVEFFIVCYTILLLKLASVS